MERLRYRRHFVLLGSFSALIFMLGRSRFTGNLSASFALYGALHATALEFSRSVRQGLWRSGEFIVLAAALSVITLHAALFGMRFLDAASGNLERNSLISVSAAAGALAYGILLRRFGVSVLTPKALALIAGGCGCAAGVALVTASRVPHVGPWWIAALWWWAFSGGLRPFDRQP